jgi:serine/threonine-protein phosphatase PP1 catalytic subunit
MSTNRLQNRG